MAKEDAKSHLYYGAISATDVQTSSAAPLDIASSSAEREAVDLSSSAKEHQAKLDAFQLQRASRTAAAPTSDQDVKTRLREFGEAICLFGEGPYERRERLRLLLARRAHKTTGPVAPELVMVDASSIINKPEVQPRLFFSEGGDDLVASRKWIARYSLPRSIKRLKVDRKKYGLEDPFEAEATITLHNKKLQQGLKVVASQVGADRPLTSGKFSPNDNFFATASWSPTVKIWTVPSCDHFVTLTGHRERVHGVAWNPNFNSTGFDDAQLKDVRSPTANQTSDHPMTDKNEIKDENKDEDVQMNQYSEGCHIATGGSDLNINLWKLSQPHSPIASLTGHEDRINRVEFHPSGRFIGSTSHDETWRLWDLEKQKELLLQEGHAIGVFAIKFHPDGSLVLTGDLGGIVRVWDLRTGRTVLPLLGHIKQVLGISLNPRMPNQVATCSDDNTVRLWDLRRERCVDTLLAHDKMISEVVFEPKFGRFLVTSSYDCTLKVWNAVDLNCTRTLLGHEARVMGTDITNNGNCIGSVSFDRTLKLWCPENL